MTATLLALLVAFAPALVSAGSQVTGIATDLALVLPGNAYYMSSGPAVAADIPAQIDGLDEITLMRGAECLRVTLFTCEGFHSVWVERLLINRAGGAHSESCYSLCLNELGSLCPQGIGRVAPTEIIWLNETTFEMTVESAKPFVSRQDPVCLLVHWVGDGEFEVTCGPEGN